MCAPGDQMMLVWESPAGGEVQTVALPAELSARSMAEVAALLERLRVGGVAQAERARVVREAEISERRGQFRALRAGGVLVTMHLPARAS